MSKKYFHIQKKVRAAYIYTILTQRIRSELLNNLTVLERDILNSSLEKVESLTGREKNAVIRYFIRAMKAREAWRKKTIDQSLLYSMVTLSIITLGTFLFAFFTIPRIDGIIDFMESILNNGGLHLILLPFLAGYVQAETGKTGFLHLIESKNHLIDIPLAITTALIISGLFIIILRATHPVSSHIVIKIAALILSVTAAPAVEELFFRYIAFLRAGKKHGYLLSGAFSSLLFSLVHLPGTIPLFFLYFGTGILLCGLAYFRKTLFAPFTAHAFANLFILIS